MRKAQSILEYGVVLALLTAALFAMQVYVKRGLQAGVKIAADQLGRQEDGIEPVDPRQDPVTEYTSTSRTPDGAPSWKNVNKDGQAQIVTSRDTRIAESDSTTTSMDKGTWKRVP